MPRHRTVASSPQLAQLFSIAFGDSLGWDDAELAAILQAQLRSPLLKTLKPRASEIQEITDEARSSGAPIPETLGALLAHPRPSLYLLRVAKDYAKSADSGEQSLPPAVATALYLAAIAAGITRRGQHVSTMDDATLVDSLRWLASQSWVDESLRVLAAEASSRLNARD